MQNSTIVLYHLSNQAIKDDFVFDRLYRQLYNEDFYIKAYQNLNKKPITQAGKEKVTDIIQQLKYESYHPTAIIQSKRPNFSDQLLLEVCRMLLQAIYEPNFSNHSHSYQPNKSCHTALKEIKQTFSTINWFITGNIKDFYETMDYQVLIQILRKRIKDEKFIRLMWKFLKAGYLRDWEYNQTFSQTAKGGIISPILSNIYLNELDQYVNSYLKSSFEHPSNFNKDSLNNKLVYVRYADQFVLGVNGSKKDSEQLLLLVKDFLKSLQLQLKQESSKVIHHTKSIVFLNYELSIQTLSLTDKRVQLLIPKRTIEKWIMKHKMVKNIDAKPWVMLHRTKLVGLTDLEIIKTYNSELFAFYQYYSMADNVSQKLWQLHHVYEYSCLKTLANKYKSTVTKIRKKYKQGKYFGVLLKQNGEERIIYFYKDGYKKKNGSTKLEVDYLPIKK